jgi:dephospho-CoA kinase
MPKKKFKIAITGGIGSGKSTFCNFLAGKGYPIIKADDISKQILAGDKNVRKKVIEEFGEESFINDQINKKFLADKIFSNPANVVKINSILHPEVKKKVKELMQAQLTNNDIAFTEAALIYEAEMEDMFDYVVLITAKDDIRMKRITANGRLTEAQFRKRDENQIRDGEKKKRADFIFENNGNINNLKQKTELLIAILTGLASSKIERN